MNRSALGGVAVAACLAFAACTSGPGPSPSASSIPSGRGSPSATASASPGASASGLGPSASRALQRLCRRPAPSGGSPVPAEGPTPPLIAKVEQQVEDIRGLDFTRRVPVDAVSHGGLVAGLRKTFDESYPARIYARKSLAWATIGAVPAGTDIRAQLERFASTQVIGYYDTEANDLVFQGSENPSPTERVTLAHELTHAVDDQHFGLDTIDSLAAGCDDEPFASALALAEGDATYVMIAYAQRYLSIAEQIGLGEEGTGSTAGISPFLLQQQTWSYTAGLAFVQALVASGGEGAVDAAFRHPPVSTEQILHPDRYPNDLPDVVDVPQLAPGLGDGWRDLDVQAVGEEFLSLLLGLRLDRGRADEAASGWGGGLYRAWTDGEHVAVVMRTTWDSPADATRFASAMRDWLAAGGGTAAQVEPANGSEVTTLFASDPATLGSLARAAGASP